MPNSNPQQEQRYHFIQHMLQALETPSKDLTKWEEDFTQSVRQQFNVRGTLTDRQVEILDGIYTEKTD